jgi:hypothetical protein
MGPTVELSAAVHVVLAPRSSPTTTAELLAGAVDVLAVAVASESKTVVAGPWGDPVVEHALRTVKGVGKPIAVHEAGITAAVLKSRGFHFDTVLEVAGLLRAVGLADTIGSAVALVGGDPTALSIASTEDAVRAAAIDAVSVFKVVDKFSNYLAPPSELWALTSTARLNLSGLRIDHAHAASLHKALIRRRAAALAHLATAHPTFDTSRCRSQVDVRAHCRRQWGIDLADYDRAALARLRYTSAPGSMLDFLEARRVIDITTSMVDQVGRFVAGPSRVHSYLRFAGAHTGRFSSGGELSGRVNIHGLAKGSDDVPELRELRQIFVPDDGEAWVAGDLSTIEPRVLAFLADERELLGRFEEGIDVYLWFGRHAFPGQRIVKDGENAHLRRAAKQAVLGLGFGMGARTFGQRLAADGLALPEEVVQALRDTYNEVFPRIRGFRQRLERAVFDVAGGADKVLVGHHVLVRRAKTPGPTGGRTIVIELPTGRCLHYHAVRLTTEGSRDGSRRRALWAAQPLPLCAAPATDGGVDVPVASDAQWRRFSDGVSRRRLSAPVLVENVVQAVARDVLVAMAAAAEMRGLRVVLHVHDEIVAAVPACGCSGVHDGCSWRQGQEALRAVMSTAPAALPRLAGLPLACEVNERVCTSYAP